MPTLLKTFRVFISSTFSDMREERQILQKKVFPELEKHCISRGARFQAVDLRWGVTESSQLEQKTLDICLNEIKRCQQISPKPNFLILLGERYGWQPIPTKVPQSEMHAINHILDQRDKGFIEQWYRLDENAIPAEYVLQPREKENIDYCQWGETESIIRQIFRDALSKLSFEKDQQNKFFCSATHLEIINGALNVPESKEDPNKHVFAYMRVIEGLPYEKTAKDFIDLHNDMQDVYSRDRLGELKTELKLRLKDNCRNYKTNWDGQKSNIPDTDAFASQILNDLLTIIDKQIDENIKPDVLEHEMQLHEEFKNSITEYFTGREEALEGIYNYINNANNCLFLLYGLSGSGKSSVMAQAIKNAEENNHSAIIVFRFAGTTSSSSGIISLLNSICRQIAKAYAVDLDKIVNDDASLSEDDLTGLKKLFEKCLSFSSDEKPLWLFIDALDQLNLQTNLNDLYWLPKTLPSNAKLIISALPEYTHVLTYCRSKRLDLLPEADAYKILNKWFHSINRQLTKAQQEEIIINFNQNGLPVYLKLAFDRARDWKSYTKNFSLPNNVDGIINNLMDGLEKEHSKDFVQKVVSYMLSGRYQGLAENEILEVLVFDKDYWNASFLKQTHPSHRNDLVDVLKIPIVVWSRLYLELDPYMTERDANGYPIIGFFHRQFNNALEKRYLMQPEIQVAYHQKLADYFENYGFENRKVFEMPWQLMQSKQWERLSVTISNKQYFNTLYKFSKQDLHTYWTKIEIESTINFSLLEHEKIIRTLNYEIEEDVSFSWNHSFFLYERNLYPIAIKYLDDLAIYQQEVFDDDDLIETLNHLYSNYLASKNWNAAIQTCSEITEIKNSLPIFIKIRKYQVEGMGDLNTFKKTLLKGYDSFSFIPLKTVLKMTSKNILAEKAGAIAEIFKMQNQTEQALRWYDYQFRINSKQTHLLVNLFRHVFQFHSIIGLKIVVRIMKLDQEISVVREVKRNPLILQPAKQECSRLLAIGRMHLLKSKYSKAIKYFKRARKIAKEYELSKKNLECIYLLAKGYFENGDIERSLEYFEEAGRMYESAQDLLELAKVYNGMAKAFEHLNDLKNAEKFLINNTKIFEQLGDAENLKLTLDYLYNLSVAMQESAKADVYRARRDTINLVHLTNEDEQKNKKSIFGIEMLWHQLFYYRAESLYKSKKYDKALNIISDLKYKIMTYIPPENYVAELELLLRPWVKKSGFLTGFVLAILQIGLIWGLKLINKYSSILHNEIFTRVFFGAIIILIYFLSVFLIEKNNLKKASFIFSLSLVSASAIIYLAYASKDYPLNPLLGVVIFFCFHFIISYIIVSFFKFIMLRIKRFLSKRAEKMKIRELDLDEMHPFVLKSLMKCIRLEADVYDHCKQYDKSYEIYKTLEKVAQKSGEIDYLIKSVEQQLTYLLEKKDISGASDLVEKLENLLITAKNDFEFGVTNLAYELHNSYLILQHYYSYKGSKTKAELYEKQRQIMADFIDR